MLRILHDTKIDFIRWWKHMAALTILFVLVGTAMLVARGVNWSTEFTGGTIVQVSFKEPPGDAQLRATITGSGFHGAEIQPFGSPREYTIRTARIGADTVTASDSTAAAIGRALTARYGEGFTIMRSEFIGPRVGAELRRNAVLAILVSFVIVAIYLAIRFEWRFGLAAVLATAHDVAATIAFIVMLRLEVSLTVVAALLTVIGYSLNDTIIIFDRIRENLKKQRRESLYELVNRSINETLPRSVMTHGTTLAATLALLVFAGEVIRPFAWVMTFGIFTGTFSSIYVAGALLLYIERRWPRTGDTAKGTARALAEDRKRERAAPVATR
jgi:preprotein translocase subunit SecF